MMKKILNKKYLTITIVSLVVLIAIITTKIIRKSYSLGETDLSCFTYTKNTDYVEIKDYKDTCPKDVFIPSTIEGLPVTTIGSYAFEYNKLTSVTIPEGVTTISNYAFYGNDLTSVAIPESVTEIGNYAFRGNQLTSVTIPNSVTSIGESAFSSNKLTSVVIPNSVTSIGEYAFSSNKLTSVVIPNSVTTIGGWAFRGNQLTSVTIPNSVTTIGSAAFLNNKLPEEQAFIYNRNNDGSINYTSLNSYGGAKRDNVIIPEGVTKIDSSAFSDNQLTSVTIPSSVTSIGSYAFEYNKLTSVTIPEGVTTIGGSAFSHNKLTSVVMPEGVTIIGGCAFADNQLPDEQAFIYNRKRDGSIDYTTLNSYGGAKRDNVIIPESVTTIGSGAFDRNQLTSVTIPANVTTISNYAFYGNKLASVTIPESVEWIGHMAFYFNDFTSITIPENVTTISGMAFGGNSYLKTINNKTGKAFDWGSILNRSGDYNFEYGVIGTSSKTYVVDFEFNNLNLKGNILKNISLGSDINSIKSKITSGNFQLTFSFLNSNKIAKTGNIKSGDYVRITFGENTYLDYRAAVKGDITGNGAPTVNDVTKLYRHLKGRITLEDYYIEAGDVVSDGVINVNDVSKLYRYIKKKITEL